SSLCLLSIGSSSEDIRLTKEIHVGGEVIGPRSLTQLTNAENYNDYHEVYLDKGEDNRNCVTNRSNGWISFHQVTFDQEDNYLNLRVTTDSIPGKIMIKLDDLETDPVAEKEFSIDYPWQWINLQIPFKVEKDVQNIYILMEGPVSINTVQVTKRIK